MDYKLKRPLRLTESAAEVTELHLREELCAGDLRGIKLATLGDMATEDVLKVTSRLCGQPEALLAKLHVADLMKIAEIVVGFLGSGLEIGNAQ